MSLGKERTSTRNWEELDAWLRGALLPLSQSSSVEIPSRLLDIERALFRLDEITGTTLPEEVLWSDYVDSIAKHLLV